MALYAFDEDDIINAADAQSGKTYWCLDCFCPVRPRKGRLRFAHFYHLRATPSCRLYSKTQDHLLAQLQLQKLFPENAIQIERPFRQIARIADACHEGEKIIFEIQCSHISQKEAEQRICDYRSLGYEVVWLLDDKRFNKRSVTLTEEYLRTKSTYYLSIRQGLFSEYYDQFEIFVDSRRIKKSKRLQIDLQQAKPKESIPLDESLLPKQILKLDCLKYFHGSRLDLAMKNRYLLLQNWRALELHIGKKRTDFRPIKDWLRRNVLAYYLVFLKAIFRKLR